ncbi:optic atrophy 3 protein-domain-containing protein, partial [Mycena polygramma]
MATTKIATLIIRTLAKPISAQIKHQATQHERFRHFCVDLAQRLYRSEVKLRTNILGEPAKHIRPLSETRAIENGANALAEGFLFSVAATLILGEAWRSSRSQSKRRDVVDEQIDALGTQVAELTTRVGALSDGMDERLREMEERNEELTRITQRIVEFGLRGGWAE